MSSPAGGGRRARGALRVVLIGLVLVLSACASIPTSSPVLAGRAADNDPREGIFEFVPDGPARGASAVDIVRGFVRAAAGFTNNHRVARSFLTPEKRLSWRPDAAVAVYPADNTLRLSESAVAQPASTTVPTPVASGAARAAQPDATPTPAAPPAASATTVTVRTPVQARIDEDGRYTLASPGASVTTKFTLVKVGGEWRITSLDDGILVTRSDFDVAFRPFPIYFADPTGHYLVPDLHWFAGSRDQFGSRELPTALVRMLLAGPPAWMQGAVITGAPVQTQMAVAAVVVSDDEVATVDLTEQMRTASTRTRQLLLAQLQATLGQLSTVSRVKITVQRLAFDVPSNEGDSANPSAQPVRPIQDPQIDGEPVLIDGKGRVARLVGESVQPVDGLDGLAVPGANRPAVSDDGSAFAVLTADRGRLIMQMPSSKVQTLVRGVALTAPSFDPQGWVWTASSGSGGGTVYATTAASGAVRLSAPWAKKFTIDALRLSRDGTRAVLAVTYRGRGHVFVTGVLRDAAGRPTALNEPLGLVPDLQTVTDVAWIDEDRVAVLGRRSSVSSPSVERPWVVQIGGSVTETRPVDGAESLTAGNGESSLIIGTANGVFTRSGARWDKTAAGRWPAYPG